MIDRVTMLPPSLYGKCPYRFAFGRWTPLRHARTRCRVAAHACLRSAHYLPPPARFPRRTYIRGGPLRMNASACWFVYASSVAVVYCSRAARGAAGATCPHPPPFTPTPTACLVLTHAPRHAHPLSHLGSHVHRRSVVIVTTHRRPLHVCRDGTACYTDLLLPCNSQLPS